MGLTQSPRRALRWAAALAGVLAVGVAVAASELVAGLVPGVPSLVSAVGGLVIALQPPGAKDVMVALFGTNDKAALHVLVVGIAAAAGAAAGIAFTWRPWAGAAIFIGFGCVTAVAAARDPLASPSVGIASAALSVGIGLVTLRALLGRAPAATAGPRDVTAAAVPAGPMSAEPGGAAGATGAMSAEPGGAAGATGAMSAMSSIGRTGAIPDWTRRRFLIVSAGTLGGVVAAGGVGRALIDGRHTEGVVSTSRLPAALQPVPALAPDQSLATAGLTPIVIPNAEFYRIDTALLVPQVNAETWQMRVTGMVDTPLTFTYDELLDMPLYEQYVTISCVSNGVGGRLVGNALWTGVRLKEVLEAAGVQPGATQIVGRSVDGFTAGFPTAWATSPGREPLIAVGMNREPLPAAHGFPARLIIPGLYGYVSATKWLAEIELTTREAVDGYWVPLGWAKDAPILTQSRIDVPAPGQPLASGPVDVAGVAWAPDRGIERVEVRIDDGQWQASTISRPISTATWVQWILPWSATAGRHSIEVRAIDGSGDVQTAEETPPAPDGARGHHRITVEVA